MSNQPDIRLDMMAGVASSRQVARGPLLESQGLAEIPTRSKKLGESESERDGIAAFGHSRANGIILYYTICKIYIDVMDNLMHQRIARRIKALRKDRGLTQQQFSDLLGFNNRQTLAAIEACERRVKPAELAAAAQALETDVEHFTDAFRLAGEGAFSFRAEDVESAAVDEFQDRAGRWIATYRTLAAEAGVSPNRIAPRLDLSRRSSYEDAHACAEELRLQWRLGDVPADRLQEGVARELGALVLYVDAPFGISGASCRLSGLPTILVNRCESVGRRSFDLAHELFHLLTWDSMPPNRVESREIEAKKGNRVEQLAENFAAALLMPVATVNTMWDGRGDADIPEWLSATASTFRVSEVALKWRIHNLGYLSKSEADAIDTGSTSTHNPAESVDSPPRLFNETFMEYLHRAVEAGRLSLRKASRLLDLEPSQFARLCRSYGLTLSYDV